MTRQFVLFLMAGLVLAGTAAASVQRGDTELEFLGGWLSQSGGSDSADFDAWFVSGALSYFISDSVSLGVSGFGAQMDLTGATNTFEVDVGTGTPLNAFFTDVERDITLFGAGANIKVHFAPTNKWVPYLGGQIKWVNAEIDTTGNYVAEDGVGGLSDPQPFSENTDTDGILYGPVAGLRGEINEYNDFFVEAQYHLWAGDIGDIIDNGFGVFLGIVHQFQ